MMENTDNVQIVESNTMSKVYEKYTRLLKLCVEQHKTIGGFSSYNEKQAYVQLYEMETLLLRQIENLNWVILPSLRRLLNGLFFYPFGNTMSFQNQKLGQFAPLVDWFTLVEYIDLESILGHGLRTLNQHKHINFSTIITLILYMLIKHIVSDRQYGDTLLILILQVVMKGVVDDHEISLCEAMKHAVSIFESSYETQMDQLLRNDTIPHTYYTSKKKEESDKLGDAVALCEYIYEIITRNQCTFLELTMTTNEDVFKTLINQGEQYKPPIAYLETTHNIYLLLNARSWKRDQMKPKKPAHIFPYDEMENDKDDMKIEIDEPNQYNLQSLYSDENDDDSDEIISSPIAPPLTSQNIIDQTPSKKRKYSQVYNDGYTQQVDEEGEEEEQSGESFQKKKKIDNNGASMNDVFSSFASSEYRIYNTQDKEINFDNIVPTFNFGKK